MDYTVLPANYTMPAVPSWAFTRWHHHNSWGSSSRRIFRRLFVFAVSDNFSLYMDLHDCRNL